MATLIVDTHRLVTELETNFGFTKDQAEGIKHALDEISLEHVATRSDIEQLKGVTQSELQKLRAELFKWLVPLLLGQAAFFASLDKWLL